MNKINNFIKKLGSFFLVLILCFAFTSCRKKHTHNYIKGICSCGEIEPHKHIYLDGKCTCGELDPNYHEHVYVNGKCTCGEVEEEKPIEIKAVLEDSNIFIGNSVSLDVEILPNKFDQNFSVDIENSNIVSYENGKFIGKEIGTTKITIKSTKYENLSKVIELTVMPDLQNERYEVENILTAHGEDASTIAMVKYQTYNKNTSVEYTVASDTEFNNATKVVGSCYYFCELDPQLTGPFEERYIYRTYLTNLSPDT